MKAQFKRSKPVREGVIILAAGKGKRMRSALPKVLHEINGLPLILHILQRVRDAAPQASVAIVVGHDREKVEAAIRSSEVASKLEVTFIPQTEQKGTGHAARCAMDSPWGEAMAREKASILVLPGDLPLITTSLVQQMLQPPGRAEAFRLLTCELPDPTGYGRVVRRGKNGSVLRIVEEKDANLREKEIREVAASIYTFQSAFLKVALQRISNKNAQGEFYLTDVLGQAVRMKRKIDVLKWQEHLDLRGVNDPWELAQARRLMNERNIREWALKGVKFSDPWSCSVDVTVQLDEDVIIHPGVILSGNTRVARGAILGPGVVLRDMEVGASANLKAGTVGESSKIGAEAQLGPYAHLRPGTSVGVGAKIGNFVELKKSKIGERTSIAHLSYLGDAEVGKNVNIGCGFVTCNFDGRVIDGERKHRTIIEDDVFLGSDCQAVAPVRIGKGAYVASGSTITEDVEPDAMAIARSRQVNKAGYARKLRER